MSEENADRPGGRSLARRIALWIGWLLILGFGGCALFLSFFLVPSCMDGRDPWSCGFLTLTIATGGGGVLVGWALAWLSSRRAPDGIPGGHQSKPLIKVVGEAIRRPGNDADA